MGLHRIALAQPQGLPLSIRATRSRSRSDRSAVVSPWSRGPIQTRARGPPNHRPADHNVSHPSPRRRTIGCPRPWRGRRWCAVAAGRRRPSAITRKSKRGPGLRNLISSRNGAAPAFAGVALKMSDSPLRLRGADLEGVHARGVPVDSERSRADVNTFLGFLVVAFLILFAATSPQVAAQFAHDIWNIIVEIFNGLSSFLSSLAGTSSAASSAGR